MSSAIARNILRMFSACCSSWLCVLNFDSFVTPSTRWATSAPNAPRCRQAGTRCPPGRRGGARPRRRRVQADLGEDLGRRDRVRDVGLARRPPLAAVGLDREVEGPVDRPGRAAGGGPRPRRGAGAERRRASPDPVARGAPAAAPPAARRDAGRCGASARRTSSVKDSSGRRGPRGRRPQGPDRPTGPGRQPGARAAAGRPRARRTGRFRRRR